MDAPLVHPYIYCIYNKVYSGHLSADAHWLSYGPDTPPCVPTRRCPCPRIRKRIHAGRVRQHPLPVISLPASCIVSQTTVSLRSTPAGR